MSCVSFPCPSRPPEKLAGLLETAGFQVALPGDRLYAGQQEFVQREENEGPLFITGSIEQHPFCRCGHDADLLCDFPMGKGKTCDLPLCFCCAREIGEDYHLCPMHAAGWKAPQPVKQAKPPLGPRALSSTRGTAAPIHAASPAAVSTRLGRREYPQSSSSAVSLVVGSNEPQKGAR